MGKRGPKKKGMLLEQESADIIYHKWIINLKHFYLIHQQVLDEIENKTLSVSTANKFMDWWVAVIGIFSHASVQWSLPSTWPEPRHKQMRVEMKQQMEQVRMSVKDIKQNIDEVLYGHRSNTNREDEHRHGIAKVQQVGKKRRNNRTALQS
jgi:hypothetical protein